MRLLQFLKDGQVSLGIETSKGIVDVAEEAKKQNICVPSTMLALAAAGKGALKDLEKLAEGAQSFLQEVTYAPAVTGMEKIICVGLN